MLGVPSLGLKNTINCEKGTEWDLSRFSDQTFLIFSECSRESRSYESLLRHYGKRHFGKLQDASKRKYVSPGTSDSRRKRLKSNDSHTESGFQVLRNPLKFHQIWLILELSVLWIDSDSL